MIKWLKRLSLVVLLALVAAVLFVLLRPQPVPVDVAVVGRGAIETTIDEEGETRVKDMYRISAPISGKLERLTVKVGDPVAVGERLARLRPADPPIRDARTQRELSAATKAASAAVKVAEAEVSKARSALEFSNAELERAERLARSNIIAKRTLQQAQFDVSVKSAQLTEAQANLELSRRRLDSARASELQPLDLASLAGEDQCCVAVVSPIAGTVLKLQSESEQVVQAGTAVLDIGNLENLELVVDLLSTDAVAIKPGTKARIEAWGGEVDLAAEVRKIDPVGFKKVSALGIEEQRVNVVLDFTDPFDRWQKLGHGFRATIRIVTSYKENVLRVPISALFRDQNQWAVYVNNNGIAERVRVNLGQFSLTHAEVMEGLSEGDTVIVYPSDRIENGVEVTKRTIES